jgi:predicted O-methyltransferase YrrM
MYDPANPAALDALLAELERTADDFWNVSRDNARFLSMLVKGMGARRVLEVGTSNGYSTLWFARALAEVGHPGAEVVAVEFDPGRAAMARANYARAGLDHVIRLVEGDARTIIPTLDAPFDFVFLDADKPQYADYLRLALPLVRRGGLIAGDDTRSMRDQMGEYVELAFSHFELDSVDIPIDDGVILSCKR